MPFDVPRGNAQAALEFLLQTGRQPDIIHTHDWPTAMAAKFYWEDYHNFGLWKPKVHQPGPVSWADLCLAISFS